MSQHHDYDEPGRIAGPCLIEGMPNSKYHGDPSAIGNSGLKLMLDCPAMYYGHYLDPRRPPREDKETAAQRFGNIAHCALFEHDAYNSRYVVGPDVNKNTKVWKEFVEGPAPGCLPCSNEERMAGLQIREQALALPDLREALLHPEGRGEVSAYWRDERTGVLCKCRPDFVMPVGNDAVVLWDGKTYSSGDTDDFARQVPRMRYHLQNAWYSDGYAKASGKNVLAFVFIVIANEWPHPINLVVLDEEGIRAGQLMYRGALDKYAECKRTGIWPGYAPGIKTITLPKWALEE